MRVLLDATAVPADRGGVGRYLDALVPHLADEDVDLVVVCQERDVAVLQASAPAARVVAAPAAVARRPVRLAWEQVGLPALVRRLGADVLHSPHYTAPRWCPVPVVVTLHDATFFSHPELHSPLKVRLFRAATRTAVRRAARLVVPSAATRDEVLARVGGDPARFVVAHHGVDERVFHPVAQQEQERVRAGLGLGHRPYVAFLGTLEPRKNVPALVRGWAAAVADLQPRPALVLAGAPGWDDGVRRAVEDVSAPGDVLQTGYLPLEDLAGFLSGADVVAYPSLGEGFGLPVLEAMSCGAAVLTTDRLSLPEVGGDAVAYTDVDAASIARALRDLLDDPARRARLGRAALERAASFTWERAAVAHREAYRAARAEGA